jgi:hypothetical protein
MLIGLVIGYITCENKIIFSQVGVNQNRLIIKKYFNNLIQNIKELYPTKPKEAFKKTPLIS